MLDTRNFQQSISTLDTGFADKKFVLAVSGGADSMVMLHFFLQLKLRIVVAHVNYGLRGDDSDADQKLVEKACEESGVPLNIYRVSTDDDRPVNSIQEWARDLRYRFFNRIQQETDADYIVTAHHLNDVLETFIINLSKAAGIQGLTGIPANRDGMLRPLLNFNKTEIYDAAKRYHIEFREDASNKKNDYTRNFIRNEIVPQLHRVNDHFLENFAQSLTHLQESLRFIDSQISETEAHIMTICGTSTLIDKDKLWAQPPYVQFEILRKLGFQHRAEIAKISEAAVGKVFYSAEYKLAVDYETLVVTPKGIEQPDVQEIFLNLDSQKQIVLPEEVRENLKNYGTANWAIDSAKIQLPLKLRRPQTADVFQPIGMRGKKKIAKFFKDEKIPILARQNAWLLCDAQEEILGLLPFRQDGRHVAGNPSDAPITLIIQRS